MSVPHSLLGVFLVNVLVHMHLLIGGVGVHWYCIISRASAGLDPKRLFPATIVGSMECVAFWLECNVNVNECVALTYCRVAMKLCMLSLSDCFSSFHPNCSQHYSTH